MPSKHMIMIMIIVSDYAGPGIESASCVNLCESPVLCVCLNTGEPFL